MLTAIELSGTTIPIHLIRKRKRHLSFRFLDTTLQVSAPLRATQAEIEAGLRTKADWILSRYAQKKAEAISKDQLRLLGEIVTVRFQAGTAFQIRFENAVMTITHRSTQTPQAALTRALNEMAHQEVLAIFDRACQRTGLKPNSVTLKNLKSSLGRCSSTRHIILATRLIHYPREVILAVCYHELAHLNHMNHSQRFYDQLEGWMPDYRKVMKNARNYPSVSVID